MRSSSLTAFTAIMILLLTACGGEPKPQAETPTDPSPQAQPTTTPTDGSAQQPAEKPPDAPPGADFKQPMVPGSDPTAIGNLLQPTNPEQRLAEIEKNIAQNPRERSNPFDIPKLPLSPEIQRMNTLQDFDRAAQNLGPRSVPDLPKLPLISLAPPPGATPPVQTPLGNPGENLTTPATNQRQPQGGGNGRGVSSPAGNGRGVSSPAGNGRGVSSPAGNGRGVISPAGNGAVPSRPPTPRTVALPQLQARGVPDLPGLPTPIGPKLPPAPKGEPIAQIPPSAQAPRGVPDLPKLPTPIGPKLPPEPVAQAPQAPPSPPPPPDTKLADATEVTGVIEVGNQIQIIAKAPNEPSSRYIKVGQKIANGQVTVKRVEKKDGEPIVILEQNGVEVRKLIGEKVAIATDEKK
ncbi:hypothetical protein [Planktothricoides raciborskii]|uniref:Uncharacterized protein n=2 Tax=Planktothricoides raciborskii TaxID=132608 RepID=A0AAU8JKF5_9CYAN|nr:hypothetical protein [Planktothricoides raciborskii]MBD2547025.1 hypothetical protein [Planktothricoides raciborskii FACHB-1370]MBD2581341.1 hypothetical protein [Planktothricoides raciborskii FACHB-1261]